MTVRPLVRSEPSDGLVSCDSFALNSDVVLNDSGEWCSHFDISDMADDEPHVYDGSDPDARDRSEHSSIKPQKIAHIWKSLRKKISKFCC